LSIVIIFIVIIIIVGFILITSMKEEVLTMSKLRNIYLYLVSFVALMMILIGLIFTVQNITDVLFPTNYYYESVPIEKSGNMTDAETDADKKILDENQKRNEQNQRTQSKKNVAKSVAVVIVALPTFAYHWRKIEKEKKEQV